MTTRETLEAARALIANPQDWCQGQEVYERAHGPSYCAIGAIRATLRADLWSVRQSPAVAALGAVTPEPPEEYKLGTDTQKIAFFNDVHFHDEVLELFDRAILKAHEAEAGALEDVSLSRAQVALGHIEGVVA